MTILCSREKRKDCLLYFLTFFFNSPPPFPLVLSLLALASNLADGRFLLLRLFPFFFHPGLGGMSNHRLITPSHDSAK